MHESAHSLDRLQCSKTSGGCQYMWGMQVCACPQVSGVQSTQLDAWDMQAIVAYTTKAELALLWAIPAEQL